MAKRLTTDLPEAADHAIMVVVLWADKRGRTSLHVHHRSAKIPFEVAREGLVTALAQIEPEGVDRGKFSADAREAARGLEHADTPELRKRPS